ncbi:hypothetical protein NXY11_13485 [Parabacteroides faecis]|uniref:hypothetical protein n=1 Tax=Parabacteroides faecis TaxID=1217282 RepID=UPI0021643412|nr:hypothetical protein [Parabacteroides faecis]MCS2892185.1 hypothetical protein [Parabacteroides faecis]UVQ49174.1 hypothetical protein NXY11_13485 [Parabacteroides faecis]
MKNKSTQIILKCIVACFLLFNIGLLFLNQQHKSELNNTKHKLEHLENIEIMFEVSKETTVARFKYEQCSIGNSTIYLGSDNETLIPVQSITNRPKLVIGLNHNMCRPCVEGVFTDIKEVFPDFASNPDIICIADIERRFKDDYYGKRVVSFHQKEDYPLYEIETMPYFFILDKDLCAKLLFITDKTSPELTKEYLKIIKERYITN